MSTHAFHNLGSAIDELHHLFESWDSEGALRPPLDLNGEIVLRLAIHEWIANLVQHASFGESPPEIRLDIQPKPSGVEVGIEDTSAGFDLMRQIEEQTELLGAPAPSERGRGLLMLITCTEDLDYRPAGDHRQRLSFRLTNPAPSDAVFESLFRPHDLASPPTDPVSGDGHAAFPSPPSLA